MVYLYLGIFVLLLAVLIAIVFVVVKKTKKTKIEEEAKIHTTQEQLPFEYIRRGVVKLKNEQYIKLLIVPSINTQLMEEEEREIVRETYAGLLNSLDFKVQFYKQSRLVDISDYIDLVNEREMSAEHPLVAQGLAEYSAFIRELVKENSVQTKKDYLVVSYRENVNNKSKNDTKDDMKKYRKREEDDKSNEEDAALKEEKTFEKAYKTLIQREKTLQKQLRRFGMGAQPLGDKEAFELFYISYNKERSVQQSLKGLNPNNFTSLYVKREGEV